MVSNYNRKSASSGSRKTRASAPTSRSASRTPKSVSRSTSRAAKPAPRTASRATKPTQRVPDRAMKPAPRSAGRPMSRGGTVCSVGARGSSRSPQASYRAMPGGRYPSAGANGRSQDRLTSVRVGDLDRADRAHRVQNSYRRHMAHLAVVASLVVALVIAAIAVYNSNLFAVENITVSGVEHLTTDDMTAMANIPTNTTLLRVDAAGIRERLLQNAWVANAKVKRIFPNTLELALTERSIAAVVDVPTEDAKSVKRWAIASDHTWLMPIPAQDSEAGQKTSPKVYEDAAAVLSITNVPYGTKAEIGKPCTDGNVNNALDIVASMTTELSGRVTKVSATDAEGTTLTLDSNVEIAFGKADNIRDKERVVLKIMEENPTVVYINVRVVDRPTWRAL